MNKPTVLALCLLFALIPARAQSRYGLSCYGTACTTLDQEAENRLATAHTICGSGDTSIVYPKNNKPSPAEMALYWRDIYAADRIANSSYRIVGDCAQADLVVKITLDTLSNDISLVVTEGDSGAYVFSETRAIQDKRSDLVHAAQHFRDAVKSAQLAAEAEQSRLAEEYRHQQQAEAAKREHQRCQTDFDSLKQNIIAYRDIQKEDLPQSIQEQIKVHNGLCTNQISIEVVENQRKAEIEAKAAQQEAATEQAAREKSAAQLEKAKADAFVVWAKQMANAPFVPPVEGWTHEADLGSALWYIILPKTGFASNCRLAMNGSHPVLDCPDSGQNDYISVVNNEQQGLWRRIPAGIS